MRRPSPALALLVLTAAAAAAVAAPANRPSRGPQAPAAGPASAPAPASRPAAIRIAPPGANWELVLPPTTYGVITDFTDAEKKTRHVYAMNGPLNCGFTVRVEPAEKPGANTVLQGERYPKDREEEGSTPKKNEAAGPVAGQFVTMRYDLAPKVETRAILQRRIWAYAVHEGTWITVHFVGSGDPKNVDREQASFVTILKGVRFEPVKKAAR